MSLFVGGRVILVCLPFLFLFSSLCNSSWGSDPNAPFHPPEQLQSKIEEFEMNEVPELGLAPRPPVATKSSSLADIEARSSKYPENSIWSGSSGNSGNSDSAAVKTDKLEFIRS